jgi:oligopeptidase B
MDKPLPMPPRAEKRPRVETWHGYEKRDDYHWLKADNWQDVMHDPAVLPQEIRTSSKARTPITRRSWRTRNRCRRSSSRN